MKKIFLFSILLLMYGVTVPRAQIRDTTQPKIPLQFDPDLLFQKTGKQKTAAWLAIAGYYIDSNVARNDPSGYITLSGVKTGVVMLLAGVAAMVASIPFFVSPGKKRRESNLLVKNRSNSLSRHLHYKENLFSFGININT